MGGDKGALCFLFSTVIAYYAQLALLSKLLSVAGSPLTSRICIFFHALLSLHITPKYEVPLVFFAGQAKCYVLL